MFNKRSSNSTLLSAANVALSNGLGRGVCQALAEIIVVTDGDAMKAACTYLILVSNHLEHHYTRSSTPEF